MYVWTEKAEADYRAKWPDSPCKRLAGQEAKYDGKALSGIVIPAYMERGWIKRVGEYQGGPMNHSERINGLTEDIKHDRWKKLKILFQRSHNTTLSEVSKKMGFSDKTSLSHFVETCGEELAEKYGRLPEPSLSGGRKLKSQVWRRVMEVK
jgi:hypothetical protein